MERIGKGKMMPKVGRTDERTLRARKLKALIMAECHKTDVKNLTGLAAALDVKYGMMYSRLKNGTISALMMRDIIMVLKCDNETVLKMMGR